MNLITNGDIFESTRDYIVIPTNCRGVNGAGLALQAARKYPALAAAYTSHCIRGGMKPGTIWEVDGTRVIWAATKDHWRYRSRLSWVTEIIGRLRVFATVTQSTIAIPALGCGNGELPWDSILTICEHELASLDVDLYAPHGVRTGDNIRLSF